MTSTSSTISQPAGRERPEALTWRSWPLVDRQRSSWLALVVLAGAVIGVRTMGGGWILALAAAAGLAATLWAFLLPVEYEVASLGLRRRVLNHTRLVPWHAIRAYKLRGSGIVLYQQGDPGTIDLLRSMFVPYPSDADELLCSIRQYASHATELPQ